MSNKKKILIFTPLILVFIFAITYTFTVILLSNKMVGSKVDKKNNEQITLDSKSDSIKIIYESMYLNVDTKINGPVVDEYIEKYSKDKEAIKNMTKEQVVAAFKKDDYILKNIKGDKIVFCRNVGKYKYNPNKYIIGIKDNYLAIYKTNNNREFILESPKDVTNININELTDSDIELLKIGDKIYEFNTKEDAKEGLLGMFRS